MKNKILLTISVILSIAFAAAHFFFGYKYQFYNICFSARSDAGIFIANDDETTIDILKMNGSLTNRADSRISYKKIFESPDGKLGYNHPLDIAEFNGKVYLLNVRNFFSEYSPSYEICRLDFNSRKMDVVFSFSDEELDRKLRNFLANKENSDDGFDGSSYFVCGETFEIDNDGIILYFAERPAGSRLKGTVYKCKLVGGEFAEAEPVSEYLINFSGLIAVNGQKVIQFDNGYHLLIGGELPSFLADDKYLGYFENDEKTIVGITLDKGEFYLIDLESNTKTEYPEIAGLLEKGNINFTDLLDLYTVGGGKTVAVCSDGEKSFLFDSASGKKLSYVNSETPAELIFHSLIAVAAAFAAVWLAGLLIRVLKTRGKVSIKFAAAVIPVMLVCDTAAYAAIGYGTKVIGEYILKNSLKAVSTQYRTLAPSDGIGDFSLDYQTGEYLDEVTRFIGILVNSEYLRSVFWTEDSGISADVGFLGYVRSENKFVSAADIIEENYDIDYKSLLPSKTAEIIERAIENRSEIYCRIYDYDIERVLLVSPAYFSEDGSVNGVFLYSVSAAQVRYGIKKIMSRLFIYMLILSAVTAMLFTVSAVFPLRKLKVLQKKSADYLSGGYNIGFKPKIKRGGCVNEIDVISEKFDEFVASVTDDFVEIENLRKANAAYFSDVILKIFNKKSINQIKFGESASAETYCIKVMLPGGYSEFDKMNRLLSSLANSLEEHGAFAANIDSTGFTVYSLEPRMLNILFFLREYDPKITAAADKCYINIGIVNIGGSFHFNIRREDEKREKIITDTLINTKSSAVVTENALRSSSRRNDLPAICVGMVDNEFIYEISDGVQRRFSSTIQDQLKKGIEFFFNGNYTAAREMFVMILKFQQDNSVARYYINLIDHQKNLNKGADI